VSTAEGDTARPLVDANWLRERLRAEDLRLVHVSLDRDVYDERHIPEAVFADLHTDLARLGLRPETGDVHREYLVPDVDAVEDALKRWGVSSTSEIVFYDDVGKNRHAIRGYWLLLYYGFPRDRLHVLDGGLDAWERADGQVSADEPEVAEVEPVRLPGPRRELIATADDVLGWSEDAERGTPRLLDVRTREEFTGEDARARRGGHVPGAVHLPFESLLTDDNQLRSADEIRERVASVTRGRPEELRATYCQGGVRAALAWFPLSEVAGLSGVRNYAESWEEWGNREDLPVETGGPAST